MASSKGSLGLVAQPGHRQPRLTAAGRVDQYEAGLRIVAQIARSLAEDLVRQRDVVIVDLLDMAEIRDIGDAIGRGRRDDRRDHTLEAIPKVAQAQAHVTTVPAREPGVCSKTRSTSSVAITISRAVSQKSMADPSDPEPD